MKKKLLLTVLTVALATCSVACGSSKLEPAKNSDAAETTSIVESASDDASSEDSESATESASEESSADTSADDSETSISGEINGNTYENDYFNIKIDLTDDYKFATNDELIQINSALSNSDAFKNNKVAKKLLDDGNMMIVAYAVSESGKSLNVVLQSIGTFVGGIVDEESILEAGKAEAIKGLEAQGLTDITVETEKVTFLGEEHVSLLTKAKANDTIIFQRAICLIKDGYISLYTASGVDAETFDKVLLDATTVK